VSSKSDNWLALLPLVAMTVTLRATGRSASGVEQLVRSSHGLGFADLARSPLVF